MEIKIGDFGLATKLEFDGDRKRTICGTPNYIAPEVYRFRKYGRCGDWWSVGVIFYEMMFKRTPFASDAANLVMEKVYKYIQIMNQ